MSDRDLDFGWEPIEPRQLRERLERGEKPVMVDVREEEEVAHGMIPGAIHIPLGELPERHAEIPAAEEIILICKGGVRSAMACEFLASLGYRGLKNLTGGMVRWYGEA